MDRTWRRNGRAMGAWQARLAIVLVVVMSFVLAGCRGGTEEGGGDGAGGGGGESAAPIESLGPPESEVTLEFWTPFSGPDGPVMQAIVERFNEEEADSGITVNMSILPNPDYLAEVRTAAQADELPHVGIMWYDAIPQNVEDGIITPVDDLVDLVGISGADFTDAIWAGTEWKGARYGIPLDVHPFSMYWNKAAFAEAGLDPETPPAGEDEFVAALQALRDAGFEGPIWSNHGFGTGNTWASLMYQAGGSWTNEDYTEATFNDEAGVRALEFMKRLVDEGLQPANVEVDAELTAFRQGDSPLVFTGPWQTTALADTLGDDLGAGPFPQIFGEGVWAGAHTLAVFDGVTDDERQAAYYFINWLTSNAQQWGTAGMPAARADARESAEFQELPYIAQIAEQVPQARFFPPVPGAPDLLYGAGGANEAVVSVLVGEQDDPQAALDAAAEQFTQILQETKEEYGY